jgi:acetyl-CoA carboxylase carboxyl transferase subunit alpha
VSQKRIEQKGHFMYFLDFEKPLHEIEARIEDVKISLSEASEKNKNDFAKELARLQEQFTKTIKHIYASITPWQKVLIARHLERPTFLDYFEKIFERITILRGDRLFGDDPAIIGGLAQFKGRPVVVIGQEKGRTLEERLVRNFGMSKPEGYRKFIKLVEFAGRSNLPVVTFIDTKGAYPGVDAEERGQAQAIAASIDACLKLPTPLISVVIGEGGSGGAIAMATSDYILMLEHAVYSVISPEGCASILFKNREKAQEAAEAQKLTAQDLLSFHIIDKIIPEPLGGAHRDPGRIAQSVASALEEAFLLYDHEQNVHLKRMERYLAYGEIA